VSTGTQVDTLEAKGLIRLAAVQPEIEYLFRHALVQDAAYGSLLKQERRGLHAQVGEALEQLYPDRREELAAVLAMHFEQAGETDKAIDYLVAAGSYAIKRFAVREAYDAFDRAASLLPLVGGADDDAASRRRAIEVRLGRVESGYSFRPAHELFDELEAVLPEAEALGDDDLAAKVHMLVALGRLQAGDGPTQPLVARSLARIREIGERLGDRSLQALPLALVGMNNVFAGSLREGVEQLAEAVPLLEDGHHSIAASFARGALGVGYATLGRFEEADAAAQRAEEVAADGDLIAQLDAMIMTAIIRSQKGELDAAVPLAQECVDRAEATGASACVLSSGWVVGDALHRQGRFGEAREILQRGADISSIVDRKVWRPTLVAWLNTAAVALGASSEDFGEALQMARSIRNPLGEAGILLKRAESAVRRDNVDEAIPDYEAAAALYEQEGARPGLARALRDWGEALRSAGRMDDAAPLLRRSLTLFEELGIDREAAAVRTALALGSTKLKLD
jgi:tetratricopeptide (TPR) repeat protein